MSLLPTFGRIYTFFNVKHTYITAIIIFEIGSVVCAAAPNSVTLIIGRAVAGVGAAGLMGGSVIVISHSVELRKRALLVGLLAAVFGTASVGGPLVGGVVTDSRGLTWRFCFWMNLRKYRPVLPRIFKVVD